MERKIKKLKRTTPFIVLALFNALLFTFAFMVFNHFERVDYKVFEKNLNQHKIVEATVIDEGADILTMKYVLKNGDKCVTKVGKNVEVINKLVNSNVIISGDIGMSTFQYILLYVAVTSGVGYILNIFLRHRANKMLQKRMTMQMAMPEGMFGNMMKQVQEPKSNVGRTVKTDVSLLDVAGCEEEKKEVLEIVDFLKNPEKYSDIGATIPKGVLLVGPPGTGKTLLAKAIAGEAGVHFMYASGSEFIEKYVGVGAQRVREMFEAAKNQAPAILFIDEIDAIGKQRTGGEGSAEHDQTLNQLLVEMDGMDENNGIIVIAATNRPEVLDKAFLRKGRFDRKVAITLPDTKGREEILHVHARKKRISDTVSLKEVSKKTHGFSGADLYAVLNEAALLAVRENRKEITMPDIDEAIDRVMMGHSSKSKKYSEIEKKMVAAHESGHVVLGLKMSEADKVDKVTIVPRGDAGGYAMLSPKEDRFLRTKEDMIERICGLLGGRAAEDVLFNTITTGAHNDLERATTIARAMVTEYGMSSLGLVQLEQNSSSYAGYNNSIKNYSEAMALKIDEEVANIISDCYTKTKQILKENIELLKKLSNELEEKETLTSKDIKNIENACM